MTILLSATDSHFGGMGVAGGVDSSQPPPPPPPPEQWGGGGDVPGGNEGDYDGNGQG